MSRRRRIRRLVTNTALTVGTLALAFLVFKEGRAWAQARDTIALREGEQAAWKEQNEENRPLHQALQPVAFKVCNNRTTPVRIDWVYAAYPEDGKMVVFDSALCTDWVGRTVGDGKTDLITLNSAQPGCNWSGKVVFYAMSFTNADGSYLNVAGPFRFEGSDCFSIRG